MSIQEELVRWIIASISKHFDDRKGSIDLFIEGQIRDTSDLKDFAELRIDGPYITEVSNGFYRIYVEINVLVQSSFDQQNYHRIYNTVGKIVTIFEKTISIFKYGTGSNDDDSLLLCLNLLGDIGKRERIQVSHFGQIEPKTGIYQSTVEAHYVANVNL